MTARQVTLEARRRADICRHGWQQAAYAANDPEMQMRPKSGPGSKEGEPLPEIAAGKARCLHCGAEANDLFEGVF